MPTNFLLSAELFSLRSDYSFLEKKLSLQLKIYKYRFDLCAIEIFIHLHDS